jgi:RimJ/RimL family protein N-acetyltransferase
MNIYIKELQEKDVSEDYFNWINDKNVNSYLESRFSHLTIDDLKIFVSKNYESKNNYLFGIYQEDKHIGNIKIGNINFHHKFADIGIVVGGKDYRGRGIGSKAVDLALKFSFDKLDLNKIISGTYSNNIGANRLFCKLKFTKVAHFNKHFIFEDNFVDWYMYEMLKDNYNI